MSIKAPRQPSFQLLSNHSFQQLKKQYTSYNLSPPPNLNNSQQQFQKIKQYLQVNYLKDQVYKVSPQVHSKVPLQREQENLRDYLMEVQNDQEKKEEIRNQLKLKYFFKSQQINNKNSGKTSSHNTHSKRLSHSQAHKKDQHQNIIQLFDPIYYLQQKQSQKKRLLSKKIKQLQGLPHTFAQNIDSVKFISQAPQIRLPSPLPVLGSKSLMSFTTSKKDSQLMKTQKQISQSISQIMEKSIEYKGSSKKNVPKRFKHYRSRNDLKKATDKKILNERNKIMSMIQQKSSTTPHKSTALQPTSLNQIPPKQKYCIDFTLYMRTKTKSQLDNYMHQKLIKKPEKSLQKFQQFMLKQVKFQNEQNRHKMERFFIKMREEFRRVEKYGKGEKFDWRERAGRLEEEVKDNDVIGVESLLQGKLNSSKESIVKSRITKFRSARERFLKGDSIQRKKQEEGKMSAKINDISQSVTYVENEQIEMRQDQQIQV